jgi:NHL repeat
MTHAGSGSTLTSPAKAARFALAACAFALLLAAFAASPAAAEVTLCGSTGTAAGQCSSPKGVATDFETGHVYVADRGNNRIDVFNASDGTFLFAFGWGVADGSTAAPQTCTTTCFKGLAGSGAGQFEQPTQIAVDNIVGSPTRHNVYVVSRDYRWQSFEPNGTFVRAVGWGVDTGAAALETCTSGSGCQAGTAGPGQCQLDSGGFAQLPDPISVGPGGNVFLAAFSGSGTNFTTRVEKFSPAGTCLGETIPEGLEGEVRVRSLAVDSAEDFYLVALGGQLRKYELGSGTQLCDPTPGIETNALGLDAAGHLFASQREHRPNGSDFRQVITEFDSACNPVRRFGYGKFKAGVTPVVGLAPFSSAEGDIFASEEGGSNSIPYLKFPSPGPIVIPGSPEATQIGAVKATIEAEVNPEGKETEVHTEYVTQAHFEAEGFANALKGAPVTLAAGFDAESVSALAGCKTLAEGSCLEPLTTYRYRVVATNPDNPTGTGEGTAEGEPFTTPPHFKAAWSSEVGTDSARLSGEADPFGIPTSGYFEYVDDADFQQSGFAQAIKVPDPQPPASEAKLSFGEGEGAVVKSVVLYPLATGATYHYRLVIEDPLQQQVSAAKAFTTFSPETSPSCPANEAFRIGPAALLPDCRAYEMVSPVDKAGGDIHTQPEVTTERPTTLNQAATSGAKIAYGSYRAFGDSVSAPYTSQYIATREPGVGWSSHAISPIKGAAIHNGVVADGEFRFFSDDLCEAWLTTFSDPPLAAGASAEYFNLYRRTDQLCGGGPDFEAISTGAPAHQSGGLYALEMQGRSADGSVVAYAGTDNLKGTSAPANTSGNVQLYLKQSGGPVKFACILPGGAASTNPCEAGTGGNASFFGVTRIGNFTNAVSADGKRIFWTNSDTEGRIYLRENPFAKGGECATPTAPCTLDVSKAAEVAAGTSSSHFWTAAASGSKAIFSSGDGLDEFEVGSKTTAKIAGGFLGFLGASEDASHIYFASSEVLSGEAKNSNGDKAVPGKANLYLYEAGSPGAYSFIGTLASADVVAFPAGNQANSSATGTEPRKHNGRVSADGGHAAFLSTASLTGYDNTDAASGKADTEAFVYDASDGKLVCASCNPSGGRPDGRNGGGEEAPFWIAARLPVFASVFYAPRVLSADGTRLYFEAADSLVARDTNGAIDVYEWEELGAGGANGCKASDVTYSAPAGGCISLISSGQSAFESEFVDASPSGDDAFFTTASSLLPQDPGQLDIYDARAGGGLPAPPPPPAVCEGEACQGPYRPPEDATPASAAFNGAGNVNEPVAKKKQKKHQKKHQKKRKANKQHANRKGRSAR